MEYIFTLESVTDFGTPFEKRYTKTFTDATKAVRFFDSYVDHGFASFALIVTLTQPNKLTDLKVFYTEPTLRYLNSNSKLVQGVEMNEYANRLMKVTTDRTKV
jgi:hypothetical protein